MASSPSIPFSGPKPGSMRPVWMQSLPASPRGLALARERDWLLAWDINHWIYLFNRAGDRQAQWHAPDALVTAACADDGSAYAAVGSRGQVWWLAPDLMPRWERALHHPATAAALDPLGQYLAVCDNRSNLHLYDLTGHTVFQVQTPRPLHHLAFVPAAPFLVGSADYGLVICFDAVGHVVWRDGLVAHVGSLAVNGDGSLALLACFSEGVQRYSVTGKNLGRLAVAEPCRLAAVSFDGRLLLLAGMDPQLRLVDQGGQTLCTYALERPAAGLALGALGEHAVVALVDGPVLRLDLKSPAG
jgi:hypothetical protein